MSPLATYLVETFVTLLAVIAVAIVVLLGAKRLGVGRPHGPMQLLGRMPLDARRVVYLVKVADQVLVLGASEAGLTKLGEVSEGKLEELSPEEPPAFAQLLTRLRGNARPSKQATESKEDSRGSEDV